MKRVLVLNISHNELRMIVALKEMGYYVIGTGGMPGLIGQQYVDEYIKADYSNKDLILQLAKDKEIDAICACCNDFGVITAAYVAEQLGLPGHDTYENAIIMHHKDRFKEFALKNEIQTPKAVYFSDVAKALVWLDNEVEYPIIVKPTDLTGGKGVNKANNIEEAKDAIIYAFEMSRAKHIVIEEYIDGSQHAICTFLKNQKVVAYGSNNEYSFENPYKVEIDTYPADNVDEVKDILISQIEKMAGLLQLKDGIFHVQYRMKGKKPYIIEAMRRVLGNLYGLPCSELNGFNWDLWQAKTYCGESLKYFPECKQTGYYAYRAVMCKKNGTVKDVHIPEDLRQYVFDEFMTWKPGMEISNYKAESLGFYFMKFKSQDEMKNIMVDRYEDIYAEMD